MRHHDLDQLERAICVEIAPHACQLPEAVAQLSRAVKYLVENDISGDFVECGVFKGASIVCMIRTLQSLGRDDRDIWLYDTFEGMPKPAEIDHYMEWAEGETVKHWEKLQRPNGGSDWVRGPFYIVRENVNRTQYPEGRIKYVQGMVEATLPERAPEKIAILRLDTDFYSSTKHELEHLYPRVVSGGVIIIDDYGAFRGSQVATDEYIKENGLKVLLSRIDEHVRMFVKP